MNDYNDGRLPEPCLRLPYGGFECASVELGDGTGFVRVSDCETLRGLVADMFAVLKQLVDCEFVCEYSWHEGGECNGFGPSCVFAKRMADMGIEVEE